MTVVADYAESSPPAGPAPRAQRYGALLYVGSQPQVLGLDDAEPLLLLHASQARMARAVLAREQVDLIICDLRDPALNGIALLEALRCEQPGIPRLALGPGDDAPLLMAALNRGGISAYLDASEAPATHAEAIHAQMAASPACNTAAPTHGVLPEVDALRQSVQLLDAIVDNLPTSVVLRSVRDDYRVVMWNKAAEALLGMPRAETIGRNVFDLWPKADAERMHASDVASVAAGGVVDFRDRPVPDRHGKVIRAHMRKVVLYDAAGAPSHLVVIADDITAQLEAETALREAQDRLQRALDGAQDGLWEYDLRTGGVFMSERLQRMMNCSPGELPRQHDATSHLVHPEDLPGYRAAYINLLKRCEILQWEGRFRQPDGSYRWYRIRGVTTRGPDGRAILASGTTTDIDATRRAQNELRRHRDDLAGLVEERTSRLSEAKLAAERANLAKSEFLANMSHELRTPMHAIISFANFGVDKFENVDRERLKGYFLHIQKSAGRLLGLLNDLLDLSKLEAGKMEIKTARVNAEALLRDAALEAEALAEQQQIRIRLASAGIASAFGDAIETDESLDAWWDASRMLQVLRNLLSNAVKFSPAGSTIELSACAVALKSPLPGLPARAGIEIIVRDHGLGIPPEELESVFDKFVQSSKTKTGAGGTGLGLAICREIVAAHGGSIRAERNPAPQAGVCFIVRLPVRPPANIAALTQEAPETRAGQKAV